MNQIVAQNASHFYQHLTSSPYQIYRDFEAIKAEILAGPDAIRDRANWAKCRYRDIPCLENSRVKLADWPSGNFIHGE